MKDSMKCLLMNQNKKIALIEYNTKYKAIEKIYEMYDINHAPLSIFNASQDKSKNLVTEMNNWFRNRGIPSWRKDLEKLLNSLNVETTEELLDKAYALSLSDQYWIKEEKNKLKWEDINFFENDFQYKAYLEVSLSSSSNNSITQAELKSPNNTTDRNVTKGMAD